MRWMFKAAVGAVSCAALAVSCGDDGATEGPSAMTAGADSAEAGSDTGNNGGSSAGADGQNGGTTTTEAGSDAGGTNAAGAGSGGEVAAGGVAGGAGEGSGPDPMANSSTGTWTSCPAQGECNAECSGAREAGVGNCMVFVNNQYNMSVFGDCGEDGAIGINLNGGQPPVEGKDYAVAGLLDFGAGKASVSRASGAGSSQEFGESGTVTVLPGLPVTAQFADVVFPSGVTISGEIICH